jgi:hypothetical protein
MDIKQSPSMGLHKFGVVYKQRSGGEYGLVTIGGESVKLKFLQKVKIFIKRVISIFRNKIDSWW